MAIFSRRDIQAAIDRIVKSKYLTRKQLDNLVVRLNGAAKDSISAEWETLVLSALLECGRIFYEQNHGGETHPDILFQRGESEKLEFLTDVRVVSDRGLHERNPYDDFCIAIQRFLNKRGHTSAGLNIEVQQHRDEGEYGKRKVVLALPPKNEMDQFVQTELREFLSGIAQNINKEAVLHYDTKDYRFSIYYDPIEKRFSSGSYSSYTFPYSMTNPLTNALNVKANQLARSRYNGIKGIIIGDGGCEALKDRLPAHDAFDCKEIIEAFLRTHPHIIWVLVLRIEESNLSWWQRKNSVKIESKLYWNPVGDKTLFNATDCVFKQMVENLPQPEATPINGIHLLNSQNGKAGRSFVGGYTIMQGKSIKISARTLTELLAGKIDNQRFLEDHGCKSHPLDQTKSSFSFFERQIADGNTLKNVFVEKNASKDDDWIVLEYDGPDAAISPFRVPEE